ncbi:MAG: hypothetical protein KDA66_15185, partial [Planctomycetaceae bacterium]|nr:hypothetical protein [Planctomycetaceae bacterium]
QAFFPVEKSHQSVLFSSQMLEVGSPRNGSAETKGVSNRDHNGQKLGIQSRRAGCRRIACSFPRFESLWCRHDHQQTLAGFAGCDVL